MRSPRSRTAAEEALRSSLAKATGNTKIGIINSPGAAAQCIVGSRAGAAGNVVRCRGSRSGGGGAGADCRPSVAGRAGSRAGQGHGLGEATHRRGVRPVRRAVRRARRQGHSGARLPPVDCAAGAADGAHHGLGRLGRRRGHCGDSGAGGRDRIEGPQGPGRGDPFAGRNSRPRSDRSHGEGVSEASAARSGELLSRWPSAATCPWALCF